MNIEKDGFVTPVQQRGDRLVYVRLSSAVVHPDLSNQLAVWRNLWNDGVDLARHARSFMAEHLAPS